MAQIYKTLDQNKDVNTNQKIVLHEYVSITGSILNGTYGTFPNDENVKNPSHGRFQRVYDYPYLSSSANHIFDLTLGYSSLGSLYSSISSEQSKKSQIYNSMAQVSMGRDQSGNLYLFDVSGSLNSATASSTIEDAIFINYSRLLTKDQIQPGYFSIQIGTGATASLASTSVTITDSHATSSDEITEYFGGQASYLKNGSGANVGQIFYDLGFVVLDADLVFTSATTTLGFSGSAGTSSDDVVVSSSIQVYTEQFRRRIIDLSLQNTTEINSTIYFCRANANEFNFSSNPTYTDSNSKNRTKTAQSDTPVTYITTVALADEVGDVLAVAKLSEPLQKDPSTEFTLRVRLDY